MYDNESKTIILTHLIKCTLPTTICFYCIFIILLRSYFFLWMFNILNSVDDAKKDLAVDTIF